MLFNKMTVLATAAAVSGVVAQPPSTNAVLEERMSPECLKAAAEVGPKLMGFPTPTNDALLTVLATAAPTKDCKIPAVTGSLTSEYSAYWSSFSSWQQKYATDITKLMSACKDDKDFVGQMSVDESLLAITSCSKLNWAEATGSATASDSKSTGASSSGSATAKETGSSTSAAAGAASTSADGQGAASRQTGATLAAAALAGVVALGLF